MLRDKKGAQNKSCQKQVKQMDTKNNNRVNMIDTTTGHCDANTGSTSGIPAFALRLADVKTKRILINALNQIGIGNTKGVTQDTNLLRLTMRKIAMKCANATIAYANSEHNNTLLQAVNFNKSKLDKLSKGDIDDACEAIHDAANANLSDVVNFGIVAGDVTDLQTAIDVYRVASQNPRQALISKSEAIRDSKKLVREIIRDLFEGQMDKMVNTLEETDNAFWKGYFRSRDVVDLGITHAKVSGTVYSVTDAPLEGVSFKMFETATENLVKEVFTDSEGKFKTGQVAVGDFDFKWEKNGYQTKIESNVHIAAGKEIRRKVVLVKPPKSPEGGLNTQVREGDVMMGMIQNIIVEGIEVTKNTSILIEVFGSPLRFYASINPNDSPSGIFLDVQPGMPVQKNAEDMAAALGFSDTNKKVNVQNTGAMNGHYKITFMNLGNK